MISGQSLAALCVAIALGYYMLFRSPGVQSVVREKLDSSYDYIIVGAGSAGSVVAARLAENPDVKVLLLEAGGHYDEDEAYNIPLKFLSFRQSSSDWGYFTESQTHALFGLKDRKMLLTRGKVFGGTGVINAAQYTRGSRHDFDDWERMGCSGWSFKDVFPYFLKSEDMTIPELQSSKYHSTGGPMAVSSGQYTELADIYAKAGKELGYEVTDYNGENQEGFSAIQLNTRNGVRSSTAMEYIGKADFGQNLHLGLQSTVTEIKIDDNKATGVYVIRHGENKLIRAKKEIVVSGGSINSAQLLMLSGIGPKKHLEEIGIQVVTDLPVGENLQDHMQLPLLSSINENIGITNDLINSWRTRLDYYLWGTGVLAGNSLEGSAFVCTYPGKQKGCAADIQFMLQGVYMSRNLPNYTDNIASEFLAPDGASGITVKISHVQPKSVGTVKLRTPNYLDHPLLDPKYLTEQDDIDTFIRGIRIWEKLIQTPSMQKIGANFDDVKLSVCGEHEFRSDKYWECYVRHFAFSVFHPTGTCKMGGEDDRTAVVDPELKVKGITGLRVVDASVMPKIVSGNTNAATVMIAEKAADMIQGINTVKSFRRI